MAGSQVDYRAKLRNKSQSQQVDEAEDKEGLEDPTVNPESEPVVQGNKTTRAVQVELEVPVVNMEDFEVVDLGDKLNLLMAAINKINTNLHLKNEDLQKQIQVGETKVVKEFAKIEKVHEEMAARIDDLESKNPAVADVITRLESLETENAKLKDDMAILKGITQVHDRHIESNTEKVVDLAARSMANNVVISGICGETKVPEAEGEVKQRENCKKKVLNFFRDIMKMDTEEDEVLVAHRIGKPGGAKPRLMVVRCSQNLRDRIFKFTSNLKDVQNSSGDPYFVNVQLPEPRATEKKEREERMKAIKKSNAQIPEE